MPPAGVKVAYYGGSSTEPVGTVVDAYGGSALIFNRQDGAAGTGLLPLRTATGTNFSATFQLALRVVTAGSPATTISARRVRLAGAIGTGLALYFVASATYLNQTVTPLVPTSGAADGAVPAGYAAVTTSAQTYDAAGATSTAARNGGFARLVLGVDNLYPSGPTGTLAVPLVFEYDEV
jgi:hypothetical protein